MSSARPSAPMSRNPDRIDALFKFTSPQLLAARLGALEIGAVGGKRRRGEEGEAGKASEANGEEGEDEDDEDDGYTSSGGDTVMGTSPGDSATVWLEEVRCILRASDDVDITRMTTLTVDLYDLAGEVGKLAPVRRQEVMRLLFLLQRVMKARDPNLTEMPESDALSASDSLDDLRGAAGYGLSEVRDDLGEGGSHGVGETDYAVRSQQPPAEVLEEVLKEGEYVVNWLVDRRRSGKGKSRTTQYLIRWAKPFDDSRYDTWEPVQHILNRGLIEQFERREREGRLGDSAQFSQEDAPRDDAGVPSADDDDDDDDDDCVLIYDPNTTAIKTSLVLILKSLRHPLPAWTLEVLEELVITSLWRIECYRITESELNPEALNRLVDELMQLNVARADAEYGTLSSQPGTARVLTRDEFNTAKRLHTRQRVEQRARATRFSTRDERQRLLDLIAAIDAIKDIRKGLARPQVSGRPLVERVVNSYQDSNVDWWKFFLLPTIRTHQQNGLVRYRDAETTVYLEWLRKKQFPDGERPTECAADLLGSSFSGIIPQLKTPTNLPVEHTGEQPTYPTLSHTSPGRSQSTRVPPRSQYPRVGWREPLRYTKTEHPSRTSRDARSPCAPRTQQRVRTVRLEPTRLFPSMHFEPIRTR